MEQKNRVIIIGSGSSLEEGIDKGLWSKIENEEIWSLNSIFLIMPYLPKKEIFTDRVFFDHELKTGRLEKLYQKGVKLVSRSYHRLAGLRGEIKQYNSSREKDQYFGNEAIEKNIIYSGGMGLVGQFALSLAVGMRYKEIFLLGYDFGSTSLGQKNTHIFQKDIARLNILATGAGRPEVYLNRINGKPNKNIEDFSVYNKKNDSKIWNVSEISNIPYFEKIGYDKFFELIS